MIILFDLIVNIIISSKDFLVDYTKDLFDVFSELFSKKTFGEKTICVDLNKK